MNRLGPAIAICVLAIALGASQPAAPAGRPEGALPRAVIRVLAAQKLSRDGLSILVQDVTESKPLVAVHADSPRNPASVMKLVTTLAALEVLGPGYRWKTRVLAGGAVDNGLLGGPLYFQGGGDPYLVTESFWTILRRLRERGLRDITGDLVIDNSFFAIDPGDPGAFDGRPYHTYNATPEALLVNFKATRFHFRPDKRTRKVVITTDPPATELSVENRLRLTNGRCLGRHTLIGIHVDKSKPGNAVRFSGDYPAACGTYALRRAVFEPAPYLLGMFKTLWAGMGGSIAGRARAGPVSGDAREILVWRSRPLAELIRSINKYSNNVMTRQLLLTLGAEHLGAPGTVGKGRTAIDDWLLAKGIEAPGLFIDNGSGLSRDARISAATLGALLRAAYASPYMPEFIASMPISAIDGTLRKRFRDGPLSGRLHMKTGLLDHVRALAGYMLSGSGKTFVVVALHNRAGVHGRRGTKVQDALLEWVYRQ